MPLFPDEEGKTKLSAAWFIEKAGCKGMRMGNAGTHSKQALVLVNLGNASGNDILELALHIQKTVKNKFDIILQPEVNII